MRTFPNFKKIKKIQIFYFLFVFAILFSFLLPPNLTHGVAGVPKIINFQGRLMDNTGELLGSPSGTDYCYRFSIWDVSTGGTANPNQIWPSGFATPTAMTIVTRSGVFDASIGGPGGDTLDFDFQSNNTVYVNVEVATKVGASCTTGGDEVFETLDPRPQIVSSGYAINSGTVGGFTPAQSATDSQIPVLTSGAIILGHATTAGLASTGANALTIDAGASGVLNLNNTSTGNILTTALWATVLKITDFVSLRVQLVQEHWMTKEDTMATPARPTLRLMLFRRCPRLLQRLFLIPTAHQLPLAVER